MNAESWLEEYVEGINEAVERAKDQGLEVMEATSTDIMADLDSKSSRNRFNSCAAALKKAGLVESFQTTISKSGAWHGFARLTRPCTVAERIAIQCVLGSDINREFLSFCTYLRDGENARIVLFEARQQEAA